MKQVYKLNTTILEDPETFFGFYEKLSDKRRRKIAGYRMKKDQMLSLGAGILIDKGLQNFGLREAKVRIAEGMYGKPYFPDYPDIHFNVSHSEQMVIAVFADIEVGCDIEYTDAIDLKLAEKFFCRSEYEFIMKHQNQERKEAFYRIWTMKESFMKAVGSGMMLPMNEFYIKIGRQIQVEQRFNNEEYGIEDWKEGEYHAAFCWNRGKKVTVCE
ncbi:MAG: 4'-phosphopantetheinyl transferase superfamily protein [Lachnospiraceae bacterium]|nr:4'-phosphopantetheinyl transferase superfamily protein [Lachnospiraceae bacterium]